MNPGDEVQPHPLDGGGPYVWNVVLTQWTLPDDIKADIKARDEAGLKKYGTRLRAFNGRDPLVDAYQELLDGVVYQQQHLIELASSGRPPGLESLVILKTLKATIDSACAIRRLISDRRKARPEVEG